MNLSVVIPVYNGAATIVPLVEAIGSQLLQRFDLEVVLVNDGSLEDESAGVCAELAGRNAWVRFVDLSRNFSEHNAVMAGLNFCRGDVVVVVDDDFQNPPSEIAKLVDKVGEGYDVVFARYEKNEHTFLRNLGTRFNNLVATLLIGKPFSLYLSSFKAMSRFVVNELVKYKGPYPYVDGLILRITRNYATVAVRHDPRWAGSSGYTLGKLVALWLNMFTGFSILPLRVAIFTGFLMAGLGAVAAVCYFVEKLQNPGLPAGWATLIIALLMVSGVQLVAIGMVGEYLGRLFMKENGQPQFVVRGTVNCGERSSWRPSGRLSRPAKEDRTGSCAG